MAKPSRVSRSSPATPTATSTSRIGAMPTIPIAAVFSFLKDRRGALTWTAQDVIATLKVTRKDADKILALLQLQGYVQKTESGEWLTAASGEIVSDSKSPRFQPANIEQALADVSARIADVNRDVRSEFKIIKAVAFGDFLSRPLKCQAADVGVELCPRVAGQNLDKTEERTFLKQLAAKNKFLHVQPYEGWMSQRSHRPLAVQ
jgi:hypothetical protein